MRAQILLHIMAQLPKYTAQLKDQLKLKRSQAYLAAVLITFVPPLAVGLLVEDQRIYETIVKPIVPFFLGYAAVVWVCTLIHVLVLTLRIKNLTDSSENQS